MNRKIVAILTAFIMFFVIAPLTKQKAEAAQQVDGHPATEISLGKWYYLDNVGATASITFLKPHLEPILNT